MPSTPRILAFAGTTRVGSFNKSLVKIAAEGARKAGAEVTFLDLSHYPMPLYDADLEAEQGMPEPARRFKELLLVNDGLLISTAEYNSGPTAVLKNAVDWATRKGPGPLEEWPFTDRYAALMCASPGALGGIRVLPMWRTMLSSIGVHILSDQYALSQAHEAFAEDGSLKDARKQAIVQGLGKKLADTLASLKA